MDGNKFMHLRQPQFTCSGRGPFTKIKKESKSLKKMEIQNIFTEMNYIKPVFHVLWLMEILKN